MKCACNFAFLVDGVPVHCTGDHSGAGQHRLPAMRLNNGSLIETYGRSEWCINCKEAS